jgi:hypothetical protein
VVLYLRADLQRGKANGRNADGWIELQFQFQPWAVHAVCRVYDVWI